MQSIQRIGTEHGVWAATVPILLYYYLVQMQIANAIHFRLIAVDLHTLKRNEEDKKLQQQN